MGIEKSFYGKTKLGHDVHQYTLTNPKGMEVSILDFGCVITKISVPDNKDRFENVVLKHPSLEGYQENAAYVGCVVGRYAGRISDATISIDDMEFQLDNNDQNNTLHGGFIGFGRSIWEVEEIKDKPSPQIKLCYLSKDGEGGFPGNLHVATIYTLLEDNSLEISYQAMSDKKTAVSLTNHSYFNLSGTLEPVTEHHLNVIRPEILELDSNLLPTGKTIDLERHGPDLGFGTTVKEYMEVLKTVSPFYGIDHPFLVSKDGNDLVLAAKYSHKESGRTMEVFTNLPFMNIYSGNFLGSEVLKGSRKYSGICFETQEQPNGPNIQGLGYRFLESDTLYSCTTRFKFSTK